MGTREDFDYIDIISHWRIILPVVMLFFLIFSKSCITDWGSHFVNTGVLAFMLGIPIGFAWQLLSCLGTKRKSRPIILFIALAVFLISIVMLVAMS